jgi:hypothetical protein
VAREFDAASSQSIAVASASTINLGSDDFTVLAWVRFPAEPPNDSMVVGKRAGGFDGDEGWELKFNDGGDGKVRWDVETDVTGRQRAEATIAALVDGDWHLLAGDRTNGPGTAQIRLWYDGAVAGTKVASTSGSVDTTTPLVIGAAYNTPNTNYLTGEIGPVFIFDRLLTLAEHQVLAASFSPRFLRSPPVFLAELTSRASPEPDIAGGLTGTLGNAPGIVDNPRLVFPMEPVAAPDIWYEFADATVNGQSALVVTPTRGRSANATAAGQSTLSATLTRGRAGVATVAGQSATSATISALAPLAATVAGQSALAADTSVNVAPDATVDGQSTVTAVPSLNAAVGTIPIVGQSNVTTTLSKLISVAASISASSGVTATISPLVPVTAQSDGQSAITATGKRGRTLTAQSDGQSALTVAAKRGRSLVSTVAGQSAVSGDTSVNASAEAQVDGESNLSASLVAEWSLDATVSGQSNLAASISATFPLAASVAGASTVTATLTRGQPAAATVAAASTVTADIAPRVPIAAIIAGQSGVVADSSANVSVQAGVDAESGIRARPTYPGVSNTTSVGGFARWLYTVGGRFIR